MLNDNPKLPVNDFALQRSSTIYAFEYIYSYIIYTSVDSNTNKKKKRSKTI